MPMRYQIQTLRRETCDEGHRRHHVLDVQNGTGSRPKKGGKIDDAINAAYGFQGQMMIVAAKTRMKLPLAHLPLITNALLEIM